MMKLPNHLFPGLLSLKGVVLPSLSRNFFTATNHGLPAQSANLRIGFLQLWLELEKAPSGGQSSHSHLACHAELISLVPTFVRLFEYSFHLLSHLSSRLEIFRTVATPFYSHHREICMRILGSTIIASGYSRFTICSHAKQTK